MNNQNQVEEQSKFKQNLVDFLTGAGILKGPDITAEWNPFKVYKLVCRKGGFQVKI